MTDKDPATGECGALWGILALLLLAMAINSIFLALCGR
jgi:hypothetical protein